MPARPPKKKRRRPRKKYAAGCRVLKGDEAVALLKAYDLFTALEGKRERTLDTADGGEAVTVSIGHIIRYGRIPYMVHAYGIDNFADPDMNGWIVHLWHPYLVLNKHISYQMYITQMSDDLGQDLNSIGV